MRGPVTTVTKQAQGAAQGAWHLVASWWRVLVLAYLRFCVSGAVIMASAIAFYAVICLGPLGILLAGLLQVILGPGSRSYEHIQAVVKELGAETAGPVMRQVDGLIANPQAHLASVVSIVVLIWAALRLFEAVERSLTEIWPGKITRGFFTRKLASLGAMLIAGLLLAIFVLTNAFMASAYAWLGQYPEVRVNLLSRLRVPFVAVHESVMSLVAFLLLYKFMPVQRVPTRVALVGAVCSTLLWRAVSPAFTYIMRHSSQQSAIYGGLTGVVVFSLWAFLGAEVLLFGGHFAVAYEHVFVRRRGVEEDETLVGIAQRRAEQAWHLGWTAPRNGCKEVPSQDNHGDVPRRGSSALDQPINGVIIAAGPMSPESAQGVGSDSKGMAKASGRERIGYLVDAMRGLPNLEKLVIVGPADSYGSDQMAGRVDMIVPEGEHITDSLSRAIEALGDHKKILRATPDTPLLATAALAAFLQGCPYDSDLCLSVIRKGETERLVDHHTWVYLPFEEGWVTHTGNYLFEPRLLDRNREFIEQLMASRRNQWTAGFALGMGFLIRFALSWHIPALRYDLASMARRVERLTGARRCHAVLLDSVQIAVDIDKPSNVPVIERYLPEGRSEQEG